MKIVDSIISFEHKVKDSLFDEMRKIRRKSFWQRVGDFLSHHNQIDCYFEFDKKGK